MILEVISASKHMANNEVHDFSDMANNEVHDFSFSDTLMSYNLWQCAHYEYKLYFIQFQ